MFVPLIHLLGVASHAGVPAGVNWIPWQSDDRSWLGWRLEPHDGSEVRYLYLVPDLEAAGVVADVYYGPDGDPDGNDSHVARIEA